MLRKHFNIEDEGAHRAMNDVIVNVEVFKYLSRHFKTTEQMIERLKSPILLRAMPLGKFKGRPFSEISLEYLLWASHQKFDQDLLFSIKMELKKRKRGSQFGQSTSPFANL
jgi:DNA polymerase-3 subunit epsilon